MRQGPHIIWGMTRSDPSALSGAHLDRGLIRRVWAFARPYRGRTFAFLGVIVVEAVIGLATPLLVKKIIDDALPQTSGGPADSRLLTWCAAGMAAAAVSVALLSLVERYL